VASRVRHGPISDRHARLRARRDHDHGTRGKVHQLCDERPEVAPRRASPAPRDHEERRALLSRALGKRLGGHVGQDHLLAVLREPARASDALDEKPAARDGGRDVVAL
jgi:hypothetical protein